MQALRVGLGIVIGAAIGLLLGLWLLEGWWLAVAIVAGAAIGGLVGAMTDGTSSSGTRSVH